MENLNDIEKDNLPWKTIHIYKKIYSAIFRYWFYLFIFAISILLFFKISKKTVILNWNTWSITEKQSLLKEINKEKGQITNSNIYAKITQWELKTEDSLIISINNLILYKWFVMPRSIVLYDDYNIKKRSDYKLWYNIWDLQYFIENIIFTDYKSTQEISKQPLIKLTDNLKDTFFVSCIDKPINFTCEHFVDNFINNFYIYDLSADYKWLNNIFNQLKNTEYKDAFCDWMMKYISYAQDTSLELEWIASQCWDDFYQTFSSTKSFLNIQNQLSDWYINATLSDDPDANAYKLISYQQILYNDVSESIINEARFNSYLNFITSLLKKEWVIDDIYLDITYRINNKFLIPSLNTIKYKLTENKKAEINGIINNIEKINNWSRLDWYNWLETKITNDWLKNISAEVETWSDERKNETQQLLNSIKNLSYIKVVNEEISGNLIRISWYMRLKSIDDPIYFWANFENQWWNLILLKIWITDYDELNDTLNNLLWNNKYNMMEIYEYIENSIMLYSSTDKPSVCELIESKINELNGTLVDCNSNKISIKSSENISYKFKLNNFNLQEISISDKNIESNIKDMLWNINADLNTLPSIIAEIVSYKIEDTPQDNTSESIKNIIAAEVVKQYLWANIIDVQEDNNWIYITFLMNGIKLWWTFNPENNSLYSLSFQDPYIKINGFELTLIQDNINEINKFISDPLRYIWNIDISAYNKYNK